MKAWRAARLAKLRLARIKRLFTRLEMQHKQLAQFGKLVFMLRHTLAGIMLHVRGSLGAGEDQKQTNAAGERFGVHGVRNLYGNIEEVSVLNRRSSRVPNASESKYRCQSL